MKMRFQLLGPLKASSFPVFRNESAFDLIQFNGEPRAVPQEIRVQGKVMHVRLLGIVWACDVDVLWWMRVWVEYRGVEVDLSPGLNPCKEVKDRVQVVHKVAFWDWKSCYPEEDLERGPVCDRGHLLERVQRPQPLHCRRH